MAPKSSLKKYIDSAPLEIVVMKLSTVGIVSEGEGEMTPVEAAMAMIGRDIDKSYAATGVTDHTDCYEFNVAGDLFNVEVSAKATS